MDITGLEDVNVWYKQTRIPLDQSEIKFDVYQRYLQNWAKYIREKYSSWDNLAEQQVVNTKNLSIKLDIDTNYLKRFLFIAWNTEFLLTFNDKINNIEITRINNQWKPIQAYYSIYSICEAVICATDKRVEAHNTCLKKISEFIATNKIFTDLTPWNLAFCGYNGNKKFESTIKPINFPSGINIPSSLSNRAIPIESIACCLQAEHRKRIDDWKKKKSDNPKYLYDPGLTSFFHFLYRLRIKSNYKDVEIFLINAPEEYIQHFSDNLSFLVFSTNLVLEIIILKKMGKTNFLQLIQEFLIRNNLATQLSKRKNIYERYF